MRQDGKGKLSTEQRQEVVTAVLNGAAPHEVAQRYGVTTSAVYYTLKKAGATNTGPTNAKGDWHRQRPDTATLGAINRDAINGLSADEIRQKHNLNGNGHVAPPTLTTEQAQRIVGLLGRLAEKRPDVFASLNIMQQLARHPLVLLEVM